jgi:DNA-directed RNA polymerase subunit L
MSSSTTTIDINIEEVEKQETNGLEYSYLILKLKGSDVNPILVNTLRRVMLNNIPTYAFASECIQIEQNTSVFNNDQMRVRLTQLPIIKTRMDLSYLEDKYWLDVNYTDPEREKHPSEQNIQIYISATNTDDNIRNVTTNDVQYYENNIKIESKYNKQYPIVLIQLRPREVFNCKLKAVLGTGERNIIWAGAGNVYYNIDGDEAVLNIESHGQFDEYELFWKACRFMQYKLSDMKKLIFDKYEKNILKNETLQSVELSLDNESHTFGSIITDVLQDRDDVIYAGVGKRNELIKQITISVKYKSALSNPLEPVMQSIDVVIERMKFLENKIVKLGKKYIKVREEIETPTEVVNKKTNRKKF